jgi:hypothetical protein
MSDILVIDLGKIFFGRFSSEYTSGQIYIARNFFLQSNTRVCRSKLPSGWRPRVPNFRATNTRVSGLLEKISGNISVPWYIIYEN